MYTEVLSAVIMKTCCLLLAAFLFGSLIDTETRSSETSVDFHRPTTHYISEGSRPTLQIIILF
jgi:hypothetical protein